MTSSLRIAAQVVEKTVAEDFDDPITLRIFASPSNLHSLTLDWAELRKTTLSWIELDANLETKNSGTSTLIETFDFAEARREDVRKHASKPDPIECYKKKTSKVTILKTKMILYASSMRKEFCKQPQSKPQT